MVRTTIRYTKYNFIVSSNWFSTILVSGAPGSVPVMERKEKLRTVVVGGGVGGAELVRLAIQKKGLELVIIEPKDRIECQALYPEYLVSRQHSIVG